MAYSYFDYEGTDTTIQTDILCVSTEHMYAFKVLSEEKSKVTLSDVALAATFTKNNAGVLCELNTAPSTKIRVIRSTPYDVLMHDFSNGAQFSADSVDEVYEQLLYLCQETVEGKLIMDSSGITAAGSGGKLYDSRITTWSGRTQEQKNKELVSILDYNPSNEKISTKFATLGIFHSLYPQLASKIITLDASFFDVALELYKLDSKVLKIPTGTYKMNVMHSIAGFSLDCSSGVNFDLTDLVDTYALRSRGAFSAEVNVLTVNENVLTVSSVVGLTVGDWLLLRSETRCDNPTDAGEDWCLGAPTLGAPPVYFGEPVQIQEISGNSVTITRGLVFPKYTSVVGGRVATIKKINFVKSEVLGYPKFIMPNKYLVVTDFYLNKGSVFNLDFEATQSSGIGFMATYCMDIEAKGTSQRPAFWSLNGQDHSRFNSWKSISGWFNEFNFTEYNGSQGVDQTYTDVPSIQEVFTVSAVNPTEQGMTTHGMSYGSTYNVNVTNANNEGFMNRARFSTINVTVIGNREATLSSNTANKGVLLCDYGMTDVVLNANIINCAQAFRFSKSYSAVPHGPKVVNITINGQVSNCDYVYWLASKVELDLSLDSCINLNASSTNCKSIVYSTEKGWHNGIVRGSHSIRGDSDLTRAIFQGDNTWGWQVRDFRAVGYPAGMIVVHVPSGIPPSTTFDLRIDFDTCVFLGDGGAVVSRTYNMPSMTTIASLFTKSNLNNASNFRLRASVNANRILNLTTTSDIPVNKEITIYCSNLSVTVTADAGVTVIGTILADAKVVKINRLAVDVYAVSSTN